MAEGTNKHVKRFWDYVDAAGRTTRQIAKMEACDTQCWPWKGPYDIKGYPIFVYRYMKLSAGRIAFELFHRAHISKGTKTLRACGEKTCVNPAHLLVPAMAQRPVVESVSPIDLYVGGRKGHDLFVGDEAPGMARSEGELRP